MRTPTIRGLRGGAAPTAGGALPALPSVARDGRLLAAGGAAALAANVAVRWLAHLPPLQRAVRRFIWWRPGDAAPGGGPMPGGASAAAVAAAAASSSSARPPSSSASASPPSPTSTSLVLYQENAEAVEWLNMCWRKAWRVYQRGLERWLAGLLQPVLDGLVAAGSVPRFVQRLRILEFTLDHEAPTFSAMRRRTSRKDSDLNGVVDVRYTGGARMLLLIEVGPRGRWRIRVPVLVSDLDLECRMWMKVRLAPMPPYIGTLSLAFVGEPTIKVQLLPYNRVRLMRIPILQAYLTRLFTVDLPGLMVLPRRLEINIPPAVTAVAEAAVGRDAVMRAVATAVLQADALENALAAALPLGPQSAAGGISLPDSFVGELTVTLVEGRDLPVWGFPWQSNPYCRLTLGNQAVRSRREDATSHAGSHRAPVWNQEIQLLVEDPATQELLIEVRDSHLTGRPDVGQVSFPLARLVGPSSSAAAASGGAALTVWLPLASPDGGGGGAGLKPRGGGVASWVGTVDGELKLALAYKPFLDDDEDSGAREALAYRSRARDSLDGEEEEAEGALAGFSRRRPLSSLTPSSRSSSRAGSPFTGSAGAAALAAEAEAIVDIKSAADASSRAAVAASAAAAAVAVTKAAAARAATKAARAARAAAALRLTAKEKGGESGNGGSPPPAGSSAPSISGSSTTARHPPGGMPLPGGAPAPGGAEEVEATADERPLLTPAQAAAAAAAAEELFPPVAFRISEGPDQDMPYTFPKPAGVEAAAGAGSHKGGGKAARKVAGGKEAGAGAAATTPPHVLSVGEAGPKADASLEAALAGIAAAAAEAEATGGGPAGTAAAAAATTPAGGDDDGEGDLLAAGIRPSTSASRPNADALAAFGGHADEDLGLAAAARPQLSLPAVSSAGELKDGGEGTITSLPPTSWTASVSSWAGGVADGASSWAAGVGSGVAGWWADRRKPGSEASGDSSDDEEDAADRRRRRASKRRRKHNNPDVVDADDIIVPIDLPLEAIAEEVKDAWRLKEVRAEDLMRRAVERSEKPWLIFLTGLSATSAVLLAAVMWKLHLLGGGGVPPPGG